MCLRHGEVEPSRLSGRERARWAIVSMAGDRERREPHVVVPLAIRPFEEVLGHHLLERLQVRGHRLVDRRVTNDVAASGEPANRRSTSR